MALAKSAVIFFMMMFLGEFSLAAVHMVGGFAGWTANGHVDYKKWAATKNFRLNDTIVFEYNNQYHNVMRVNHQHFKSCNATSPIAIYTSGSDKITLNRSGRYYFMCGFPDHCNAGQKVNIKVTRSALAEDNESVPKLSFPRMTDLAMAPTPAQSSGSINYSNFWLALVALAF